MCLKMFAKITLTISDKPVVKPSFQTVITGQHIF
jgi:hypothetical protein